MNLISNENWQEVERACERLNCRQQLHHRRLPQRKDAADDLRLPPDAVVKNHAA